MASNLSPLSLAQFLSKELELYTAPPLPEEASASTEAPEETTPASSPLPAIEIEEAPPTPSRTKLLTKWA